MKNKKQSRQQSNPALKVETLLEAGNTAEALKVLQVQVAANPQQADLHYQLGEVYYQTGQWEASCQAYLKAVGLKPDLVQASIGFGDAAVELKAYLEAEKAYIHALQQDPSVKSQIALCYKYMGDALAQDLQGELAYKSYYNAFDLDDSLLPELQTAFAALAETLRQANQLEYAQQVQAQAERFAQELAVGRLLQAGQASEALPLLQAAVATEPKRAGLQYQLGVAYAQLQQWKASCEAYLQALNLKQELVEAAIGFAEASVELQAYTEAEKALTHALAQNPSIGDQVARVYQRIGDGFAVGLEMEQAQAAYQKVLELDAGLAGEVLTGLIKVLGEAKISSDASEESELLLLQLHQTQEELETLFLKNDALEKANADVVNKLAQITAERDEQAKLMSEQQTRLISLTDTQAKTTVQLAKTTSQLLALTNEDNNKPVFNFSSPYGHNRILTAELNKSIQIFLTDVLHKENVKPSYIDYLALKAIEIEKNSIGRLATTIQDAIIRQVVAESVTEEHLGVLEIGALYGVNLAILYNHCIPYFDSMKMICLDPFDGYYGKPMDHQLGIPVSSKLFHRNMQNTNIPPESYTLIQHYSTEDEAISKASQEKITLLIIDGDHTYEGIKFDYQNYLPLLQPNGLIIIDDYNAREWPGVQEFVDQIIKKDERCEFIGSFSRTAIFRKKEQTTTLLENGLLEKTTQNIEDINSQS